MALWLGLRIATLSDYLNIMQYETEIEMSFENEREMSFFFH